MADGGSCCVVCIVDIQQICSDLVTGPWCESASSLEQVATYAEVAVLWSADIFIFKLCASLRTTHSFTLAQHHKSYHSRGSCILTFLEPRGFMDRILRLADDHPATKR